MFSGCETGILSFSCITRRITSLRRQAFHPFTHPLFTPPGSIRRGSLSAVGSLRFQSRVLGASALRDGAAVYAASRSLSPGGHAPLRRQRRLFPRLPALRRAPAPPDDHGAAGRLSPSPPAASNRLPGAFATQTFLGLRGSVNDDDGSGGRWKESSWRRRRRRRKNWRG